MMDIKLTVVHTLHPDVIDLIKGLNLARPASTETLIPAPSKAASDGNGAAKKTTAAVQTAPAPAQTATAEADEEVSIDQIKLTVAEKTQAGKRDACKALLEKFGAKKVSELPEERWADFYSELKNL